MSTDKDTKNFNILNTSSNLIGFAFIVFATVRTIDSGAMTIIDDIAAIEVLIFSISSLFSYLAIRRSNTGRGVYFEHIADYVFFFGLFLIVISSIFVIFGITS